MTTDTAKPLLTVVLVLLLSAVVAVGLLSMYSIAGADVGSNAGSAVTTGSGSGSSVDTMSSTMMDELANLKEQYAKVRGEADKDAKMLLWAGLIAGILKLLLSIVTRVSASKKTKWLGWVAMGLSVPIALFSHYALGNSVFDSLVYAGAGPGAIVIHELLKVVLPEKKQPELHAGLWLGGS